MTLLQAIWPYVGPSSDASLKADLAKIRCFSRSSNEVVFLEEARRLRDIETNRKNNSENKSQIYLAVLLALIPVLLSLTEHSALKGMLGIDTWEQTACSILFATGIAFGVGAFYSSFRALTVGTYHRVDVDEIVKCADSAEAVQCLTREILLTVRNDRSAVNKKISYVVVTHKLIFRMALCLLLALVVYVMPQFIAEVLPHIKAASVQS
ncbi:MAG: hypothetical protein NXH91_06500 [Phyllobacteriaceae bacterium]|nr:hypothetical protein [Phyllobacteriaceae bacterium]